MAAPGGKFFVQDKLATPAIHHESFEKLWETKWKPLCQLSAYPFMFGAIQDFQPVAERLIKEGQKEPYDWDKYAQAFFPKAEELFAAAEAADKAGEKDKASELYLRSSAIYRIARFPAPRSEWQHRAWAEGKKAAKRGLALRERPTQELSIPHKHGKENEGKELTFYYHLPPGASADKPVPLLIIVCGLDAYRTEMAVSIDGWSRKNVATIVIEIPGTGDSPADRNDPTSPDRQWSSLLDWVDEQKEILPNKKALWAVSTGGYYAIRVAHTHAKRLNAVVAHGAGCHYMFDPEWLSNADHLEYPFDLATTLAYKFGYGNDLETFKKEAKKYSLLEDGTLDTFCTRLLLINGTEDEVFPIDDLYLCLLHGAPKEARFIEGQKHMGGPESYVVVLSWLYGVFGIVGNPIEQLMSITAKPKYAQL